MSVVFPAPLAPTRPYTPPRGNDKLTDASAVFESKRRVRLLMSMTGVVSCVIASNGLVTILTRQQRLNNPATVYRSAAKREPPIRCSRSLADLQAW